MKSTRICQIHIAVNIGDCDHFEQERNLNLSERRCKIQMDYVDS